MPKSRQRVCSAAKAGVSFVEVLAATALEALLLLLLLSLRLRARRGVAVAAVVAARTARVVLLLPPLAVKLVKPINIDAAVCAARILSGDMGSRLSSASAWPMIGIELTCTPYDTSQHPKLVAPLCVCDPGPETASASTTPTALYAVCGCKCSKHSWFPRTPARWKYPLLDSARRKISDPSGEILIHVFPLRPVSVASE